ncbi:MAG TPA: transporter substrate-binding domain-containing protein [Candidatus Flavonifractor merdipullorum]|uniref:Transporter substrate-binding domain-containing protein n=1 Tax=Candidatus Flavonifractor merdipullorum TaxID=2838590 RepID=A0A9D1RRL4_9FIRM|nr:transporter substrate-binding domain-containing protein [Candidatus Flavonifractor merdipullorum]
MKKLLTLVLALALVLSLAACGGTGNNTADNTANNTANNTTNNTADTTGDADTGDVSFTTVEEGKLHMSTNAQFPPYEMTTDDGGFEGIDVEIAEAIAEKLDLELVVDDMAFNAALTAAQTGQSDMVMAGVTVNEDRLEVMDFSDTYATGVQVVIVKEDSPIQTIDDLANAEMIGCQADTTGYIFCSYPPEEGGYGEDHVTAYDNGALAVMALMNDQVDAVVIDNAPAQEFVKANEGLKILDTEFAVEDYAIGFAKGNTALKDAVNAALKELIEDGTVQSIIDKYIPAE